MKRGRLTKSRNKWINGVIGGVGDYFEVNPDYIRIGALVAFFLLDFHFLVPLYFLMMIVVPGPDCDINNDREEAVSESGRNMRIFGIILVVGGAYYLLRNTFGFSIYYLRNFFRSIEHTVLRTFPFLSSLREIIIAVIIILIGLWLIGKDRKRD